MRNGRHSAVVFHAASSANHNRISFTIQRDLLPIRDLLVFQVERSVSMSMDSLLQLSTVACQDDPLEETSRCSTDDAIASDSQHSSSHSPVAVPNPSTAQATVTTRR